MNTAFVENSEGIYYDVPAAVYHKAPGCSHSMLKNLHPRPAHLQAYLSEKREPTAAQILGTLVHHRVLEPDKPFPQIAVKPADMKFSTKEGKAWRDEQLCARRLIIGEDAHDTILGTVASIARHPVCRSIFANGQGEVSVFKHFHYGGIVLRKARLDWIPAGNALVDVKTTQDASPESFAKEILNYRYHSQAAYYLDIWNDSQTRPDKECFILIAVEKAPPYLVAIYNLDPKAIGKGRQLNIDDLAVYIDCASRNQWPGYAGEIVPLDLPAFAYKERQITA